MMCVFCKRWFFLLELPNQQIACCSRCGAIPTRPKAERKTLRLPQRLLLSLLRRSV